MFHRIVSDLNNILGPKNLAILFLEISTHSTPVEFLLCLLCFAKINFEYILTKNTKFHNEASIAQSIERVALNLTGPGSNPCGGSKLFFFKSKDN